jgi:hypothetical protein
VRRISDHDDFIRRKRHSYQAGDLDGQPGFLGGFPNGRQCRIFAKIDVSARQRLLPALRIDAAFDEQNRAVSLDKCDDGDFLIDEMDVTTGWTNPADSAEPDLILDGLAAVRAKTNRLGHRRDLRKPMPSSTTEKTNRALPTISARDAVLLRRWITSKSLLVVVLAGIGETVAVFVSDSGFTIAAVAVTVGVSAIADFPAKVSLVAAAGGGLAVPGTVAVLNSVAVGGTSAGA